MNLNCENGMMLSNCWHVHELYTSVLHLCLNRNHIYLCTLMYNRKDYK